MDLFSKKFNLLVFSSVAIVYIIGLFVDIMDIDAAQYASIAREMLESKSFLIIKNRYNNYLDKPPLLFWLSSVSFYFFGFYNWSYKLPSVLFACLAIFSTYRFSKIYYTQNTSILAAIILATCQAFFLFTNDVRTDTILCGSVIFATWQLTAFLKTHRFINLTAGFAGIGLAMLAKGPIGLVVPVLALAADLLVKRNFKDILRWQWMVGIIIIAIILFPMCLGLYQQYGEEGLRFYFWKQSFGRITGESEWRSDGGFFFLFHSFLWSFSPWSLFFLMAALHKIFFLVKSRFKITNDQEIISLGGTVLTYVALAQSKYQLPHYIYVFFPFAAILTAAYMEEIIQKRLDKILELNLSRFHLVLMAGLWVVCGLLSFVVFEGNWIENLVFGIFIGVYIIFLFQGKMYTKIISLTILTAIGVNFFMDSHIYPSLLKYQPSSKIAAYIKNNKITESRVFNYKIIQNHSLDFYAQMIVKDIKDSAYLSELTHGETYYCYTDNNGLLDLYKNKIPYFEILTADYYAVTKVTIHFLKPSTRPGKLEKRYFVKFIR